MIRKVTFYAIFIWSLAILFYFFEFSIRIMPATISENIIQDLAISPAQFAIFGSAYYIIYSIMQIPVGILYDRYGVRLFLTIACAICTIGVFGFGFANDFFSAVISRLLIGFVSAFGFISLLILALNWFPQKYFAFLAGLGQMLGAVGPMLAGAPVAYLMHHLHNDWRMIFFGIGIYGSVLTVLIALFVKSKPEAAKDEVVYLKTGVPLAKKLKQLMRIPQVWMTMIYAGSIYVSLPLLGAYWGTLYLQSRGFTKPASALMISMIWIGLAIGSPVVGNLSDYFHRRKPFLLITAFVGTFVSLLILYFPRENKLLLSLLFVALGMAVGSQSLSFAVIADNVPDELRATAMGANNSSITLFGAIFPLLVTWIMQSGGSHGKIYIQADFEVGFLMMPIAFAAAFLVALFGIRETYCRTQATVHMIDL
jgi:MFS family permease